MKYRKCYICYEMTTSDAEKPICQKCDQLSKNLDLIKKSLVTRQCYICHEATTSNAVKPICQKCSWLSKNLDIIKESSADPSQSAPQKVSLHSPRKPQAGGGYQIIRKTIRDNPDESVRDLERQVLADPESLSIRRRWLRAKMRSGQVSEAYVKIASQLGDPIAREIFPDENLINWMRSSERRSIFNKLNNQPLVVQLASDFAEHVLLPNLSQDEAEYLKSRLAIAAARKWANTNKITADEIADEIEKVFGKGAKLQDVNLQAWEPRPVKAAISALLAALARIPAFYASWGSYFATASIKPHDPVLPKQEPSVEAEYRWQKQHIIDTILGLPRRNPDESVRDLEKQVLADPENLSIRRKWLREKLRSGQVSEAYVKIAAQLGDPIAREIFPDENPVDWVSSLSIGRDNLLASLHNQPLVVHLAADFAEHVLPIWKDKYPNILNPRIDIAAARRWANNPTEENRRIAQANQERSAEVLRKIAPESHPRVAPKQASPDDYPRVTPAFAAAIAAHFSSLAVSVNLYSFYASQAAYYAADARGSIQDADFLNIRNDEYQWQKQHVIDTILGLQHSGIPRRNPDESVRDLERQVLADPENLSIRRRWLRAKMRSGQVPEAYVKIASQLGDPIAREIFPDETPADWISSVSTSPNLPAPVGREGILKSLQNQQLAVHLAADFAEHVLPIWENKFPEDLNPHLAIAAARRWANDPTNDNRKAASEVALEIGRRLYLDDRMATDWMTAERAAASAARGAALATKGPSNSFIFWVSQAAYYAALTFNPTIRESMTLPDSAARAQKRVLEEYQWQKQHVIDTILGLRNPDLPRRNPQSFICPVCGQPSYFGDGNNPHGCARWDFHQEAYFDWQDGRRKCRVCGEAKKHRGSCNPPRSNPNCLMCYGSRSNPSTAVLPKVEKSPAGMGLDYALHLSPGKIARIKLTKKTTKKYHIDWVYVPPEYRGQGLGDILLSKVIRDANKYQITLNLDAKACGESVHQEKLENWYAKYGFVRGRRIYWGHEVARRMTRQPD